MIQTKIVLTCLVLCLKTGPLQSGLVLNHYGPKATIYAKSGYERQTGHSLNPKHKPDNAVI